MIIYIFLLILLGIALLLLEIIFLPGLIAGTIGVVFLLSAVYWSFEAYGKEAGMYTAFGTAIGTLISVWWAFRSKLWVRFSLKDKLSGKVNEVNNEVVAPGDTGKSVSALRPMGTVRIGETLFEASTEGDFIETDTDVVVFKVLPNKIIVRRKS